MSKKEELLKRYQAAAHAVQSGIAMFMNIDSTFTVPKHLRTGIDVGKAEMGGFVKLLISKGIITEEEYIEAITQGVEDEKARWEEQLSEHLGKKVNLL